MHLPVLVLVLVLVHGQLERMNVQTNAQIAIKITLRQLCLHLQAQNGINSGRLPVASRQAARLPRFPRFLVSQACKLQPARLCAGAVASHRCGGRGICFSAPFPTLGLALWLLPLFCGCYGYG